MSGVRSIAKTLFRKEDFLEFKDFVVTDLDSNALVVYLGNKAGSSDSSVHQKLRKALDEKLPVLPIVRNLDVGSIQEKMPSIIARFNAISWTDNRTLVLTSILSALGLIEKERKVFLSYVRRESTPIALQLHKVLVEARFDVFLDRFAVPPGADFQRQLDEDLGDKAFVVLLESSGLRSSRWVQHEIAYALSHRISVLALTMPGIQQSELVRTIDEAFRVRLSHSDIVAPDGELKDTALKKVLDRIEVTHARALRRRREQLLGSLIDSMRRDGCNCDPVDDWAVLSTADDRKPMVLQVAPRRPQPEDLRTIDTVRHRISEGMKRKGMLSAAVAHDLEHIPQEHRHLLAWIGKPRGIDVKTLSECELEVSA